MSLLTLADHLTVRDQVVDVALDFDEALVLLSLLLLASFHESSDVLGEELRLDGVDDVEEELPVDSLDLICPLVLQVWQVLPQLRVFQCISQQTCD
jgi:hypothetical protein